MDGNRNVPHLLDAAQVGAESPVEAGGGVTPVAGGAMGTTSAFHEGGYHVAVRSGKIAGKLAATDDIRIGTNDEWKDAIGEELLRNIAFADIVKECGPDDWDKAFSMVNKLLNDDGTGIGGEEWENSSGVRRETPWPSTRRTKFGYRDPGTYVQVAEDEYTY